MYYYILIEDHVKSILFILIYIDIDLDDIENLT